MHIKVCIKISGEEITERYLEFRADFLLVNMLYNFHSLFSLKEYLEGRRAQKQESRNWLDFIVSDKRKVGIPWYGGEDRKIEGGKQLWVVVILPMSRAILTLFGSDFYLQQRSYSE
jgi:hypothetical protein